MSEPNNAALQGDSSEQRKGNAPLHNVGDIAYTGAYDIGGNVYTLTVSMVVESSGHESGWGKLQSEIDRRIISRVREMRQNRPEEAGGESQESS